MRKRKKLTKAEKNKLIIDSIIGVFALLTLILCIYMFKSFPIWIAEMVRNGFIEIFSGKFDISYFFAAIYLTFVLFFYAGVFVFLYLLTLVISFVLIYSGILFLSTAFPNDPLYNGVMGVEGSFLKCYWGYPNLISSYDVPCELNLSKKFEDKVINYTEIKHYIDRNEFRENLTYVSGDRVTLYFDKQKQPTFLTFYFNDGSQEVFSINHVGVYTKEEYFEREKEKAVWFFGIISFSLFSVFSAMNNLKQILGFK